MKRLMKRPRLNLLCVRVICFVLLVASSRAAMGQKWGTLSAKFVFDGKLPVSEKLELNKDIAFCMKRHPIDESLLVNNKNLGIQNVVVYLQLKKSQELKKIHPDYKKTAKSKVKISNTFCRFEPHIGVVRTGQEMILGNDDPIAHNILANMLYNTPFNIAIQPKGSVRQVFERTERRPCQLTCPIHSWMKGYVVVKDHPYVGITNKDGVLEIKNIPAGKWEFQFWHERPGYLKQMTVQKQTLEDRKGLYELEIRPGKNDLGTINLPATIFK
jgi:hypothetical protein